MTKSNDSFSMDDIIAEKKSVTRRVTIQTNGEIVEEIKAMREALEEAKRYDRRHNEEDTAPRVQAKLDELMEQAKSTEREFVFQSIGRVEYDKLVEAHPPTADQRKQGNQFNVDTFPAALVSRAAVSPKITLEQAEEIFDSPSWNNAELLRLYYAAQEANSETADIPLLGTGSDMSRDSLLNLVTQLSEGSPTPSS